MAFLISLLQPTAQYLHWPIGYLLSLSYFSPGNYCFEVFFGTSAQPFQIKLIRMKKLKWSLMSAVVVLGIGGAFATRPHYDCSNDVQYMLSGSSYFMAGTEGVNYTCTEGSGTCTYYTNDNITYFPCQPGQYCTSNCFVREDGKPIKPLKPATTPSNSAKVH